MFQRISVLVAGLLLLHGAPHAAAPKLVLIEQHPAPVITTRTPGAKGNKYGFELSLIHI